jgi:S-DNA-T family DNA segregation ATPase FtsK/SpoIIIE
LAFIIQIVLVYFLPAFRWRGFWRVETLGRVVEHDQGFLLGGTLGRVLERAFVFLFGRTGCLIVLGAIFIILLLFFTNINFKNLIQKLKPKKREKKEKKTEEMGRMGAGEMARKGTEEKGGRGAGGIGGSGAEEKKGESVKEKKREARAVSKPFTGGFGTEDLLACLHSPTDKEKEREVGKDELKQNAEALLKKLAEFGVEGKVTGMVSGPFITRYEFEPAPGIKIQQVESLANDLALSLKAERIRILAPIPGKSAVGIEIPNRDRKTVYLRTILTSDAFEENKSPLTFGVGEEITGESFCADLRSMPHLLIAGTTGSGKSVCINTIVASIISRATPEEVRFLTIDPKRLELPVYDPIPHLLFPTVVDPKQSVERLEQVLLIMEQRYRDFAQVGARNIEGYNEKAEKTKPYLVIIVDELADLMLTAPSEIEEKITRLAQMSRAVGIHLVLATQRPSVDVITGLIKANFPARVAFQVASKTDSRTILDMNGAESLLGRGDMLFLPPGRGDPIRLHGAYISAKEAKDMVELVGKNHMARMLAELLPEGEIGPAVDQIVENDLLDYLIEPEGVAAAEKRRRLAEIIPDDVVDAILARGYYSSLPEIQTMEQEKEERVMTDKETDEFFIEAAKLVIRHKEASVSMLQRRLDVGWARAGRIIDQLEQAGIVGPYVGSKARKVLVESEEELAEIIKALKNQKTE